VGLDRLTTMSVYPWCIPRGAAGSSVEHRWDCRWALAKADVAAQKTEE